MLWTCGGKTPGRLQPISPNTAIYSVFLEVSVCLMMVSEVDVVFFPVPSLHEMQGLLSWPCCFVLVSSGEFLICLLAGLPVFLVTL